MLSGNWTKEKFEEHHANNPHIYKMFCTFAKEIAKYKKQYSAKCIFHRMRWETAIREIESEFKISDGWISHYAHKFMEDHPEYGKFFRTRKMKEGYLDNA
jgi:hypothetical protein